MSKYAYKDKKRTKEIYATDASKQNLNTWFYCPNPNCTAHMYICNIDGASSSYFAANHSEYRHIPYCSYSGNNNFSSDKYTEKDFNFNQMVENILLNISCTKSSNIHSYSNTSVSNNLSNNCNLQIKTIRQLYDMCKSIPCNKYYNGFKIGQMLFDERSAYMYPNGVFGLKLVECMASDKKLYDKNSLEIYMTGPLNIRNYNFVLKFNNYSIFKEIKDFLYNNPKKVVIVIGKWGKYTKYNYFSCNITNLKQIKIFK